MSICKTCNIVIADYSDGWSIHNCNDFNCNDLNCRNTAHQLSSTINKLSAENTSLQSQVKNLKEKLQKANDKSELDYGNYIDKVESLTYRLGLRVEDLKDKASKLKEENKSLISRATSADAQVKMLNELNNKLKNNLSVAIEPKNYDEFTRKDIEYLKKENHDLKHQITMPCQSYLYNKKKLEDLQKEFSDYKNKSNSTNVYLSYQNSLIKIDNLQKEFYDYKLKYPNFSNQVSVKIFEFQSLQKKYDDEVRLMKKTIEYQSISFIELQKERDELLKEKSEVQKEYFSSRNYLNKCSFDNLKKELQNSQCISNTKTDQIKALEYKLDSQKQLITSLQDKLFNYDKLSHAINQIVIQ